MSSVLRSTKQRDVSKAKLQAITTPCYVDTTIWSSIFDNEVYGTYDNGPSQYGDNYGPTFDNFYDGGAYFNGPINSRVPIPFTVTKDGALDINIDNDAVQSMVDDGDRPLIGSDFLVKEMGGLRKPTSLGETLVQWIENFYIGVQSGSVKLVQPGVLTKVQVVVQPADNGNSNWGDNIHFAQTATAFNNNEVNQNSTISSDELVVGDSSSKYRTAWVFKEPTVLQYTSGGTNYFLKLYTTFAPYRSYYSQFSLRAQSAEYYNNN